MSIKTDRSAKSLSLPDHLLVVGRIAGVYGIKGWVKIDSSTQPKENIFGYQPWYVPGKNGKQALKIDEYRAHGKGYVGHIVGVDDRDIAQGWCRKDICIEKSQLPDLVDDEWYWHQLEYMKVYSVGVALDVPGQRVLLGEVSGVMETGSNDVLVLKSCPGSIDDRERMVPWLDEFLHNIDIDQKEIEVIWDPDF